MTRLLPRLLNEDDLPWPELRAARIDGHVFGVDDSFAAVDEPDSSGLRAAALELLVPERMIVERASALWVYGVHAVAPHRHQLCTDISSRTTPRHSPRFEFRECRLEPVDVVELGALKITSPLRTAIDLLRVSEPFRPSNALDVLAVLRFGGSCVDECRVRIRSQPGFPGVRRALMRTALLDRVERELQQ